MNLATNRRIWNALRTHKNSSIIEKVLDKNELVSYCAVLLCKQTMSLALSCLLFDLVTVIVSNLHASMWDEEHWESCPMKCRSQMEVDFEPTPSSRLNESQKNAVLASLIRTGCKHRASVELICGPPGTGKTRTLSVLLHNLLIMKVRTLICAPTNVAILELASHMISLSRESFQDKRKMFLSCPLGDMLIFGNEDTSKIGSDTKEIFLDYRVNKLIECLVSPTGLKHWISSMLDFLGDYVSQNHIYLDNKVIKVEENQEGEIRQSEFKSCLKNARRRFKRIATSLVDSLSTFITHLPRSFILAQNLQNVAELMSLLDSIEALLFEESLAYEELNMHSAFHLGHIKPAFQTSVSRRLR
ncbi:uncharacterized protein [Henckelia pumila]|uniref:uncharacterized protein n=1 Tax=Henckelia pumila TaxID=405737 RepID=UPI003C6E763B